ncbi:MAG TPA: [FeFe] hydrogenase H-cluster radical SAM maturase HydE [Candidatus Hydrogenedentes bacterium]|nr:[FeFe] hydrogenase H-cluster radical SAM maturase HydE [Candidatus Hydrogenedentota bacterium]
MPLTEPEILQWLLEPDEARVEALYREADRVRHEHVGDAVHLRGLIEVSNICIRQCAYCGIRAGNTSLQRYRLSRDEILECARQAVMFGYGTVVMQAGEDYGIERDWMGEIIQTIKRDTPLAVTLSLGERSEEELRVWREAGADRYLLRFETSDPALFSMIHPPVHGRMAESRIEQLLRLRALGYEIGSGVMVGIPGQRYCSLAHDIALFGELDLDMIGVGPYLPHPATPLGAEALRPSAGAGEQVPNSEHLTYRVVALTRLVCPQANIPSTTALSTLNTQEGRTLGLQRGANVVMPNITPAQYRALYEIYPAKSCIRETSSDFHAQLIAGIRALGREIGEGPGGRNKKAASGGRV